MVHPTPRVTKQDDSSYKNKIANMSDLLWSSSDSFNKLIANGTESRADIGSEYDHSPERKRLFINGSRFNLQYNSTTKFEDTVDSYTLKPAAGDTIVYQSAERFRYFVGYIIAASYAFSANKTVDQLTGNDKIVIGYGHTDLENDMANADGWFIIFEPGLDKGTAKIQQIRNGTVVDEEIIDMVNTLDIYKRIEQRINWYNVGNCEFLETFTDDGEQVNERIGALSKDDGKGPESGNQHVSFAVRADSTTTDLELDTGSIGVNILGQATPVLRSKAAVLREIPHSGSGDYEALFAMRVDPNRKNVVVNITNIEITELSQSADAEILAIACDPDNVKDSDGNALVDSDFNVPDEHSAKNSVLEVTEAVDQFPDSTGTVVTSTADPGGYQVGFAYTATGGTGVNAQASKQSNVIRKRQIKENDYIVVLGRTGTTVDFSTLFVTEQDW